MMLSENPTQSKFAEKLEILSVKLKSVLNQVYWMKTHFLNETGYLSVMRKDTSYDQCFKILLKSFPSIDIKINKDKFKPLMKIQDKLIDEFNVPYNTLVDCLVVKDTLINLIGEISAYQYNLNIMTNYNMTFNYLELIADYSAMLMMLSEFVLDLKSILILYNFGMLSKFNQDDLHYRRLCERFVDKQADNFVNELFIELNPFSKTTIQALISFADIYNSKTVTSKDLDKSQLFRINQSPCNKFISSMNEAIFIPLHTLERWTVFGYLTVYPDLLKMPSILGQWKKSLENSYIIMLHRDFPMKIHKNLVKYFDSIKGYGKLSNCIKEAYKEVPNSIIIHRNRRSYFRIVLKHYLQVIIDEPGLIGPNFPVMYQAISIVCDELFWFFSHLNQQPSQKFCAFKYNVDSLKDSSISELMYYFMEIRYLIQQFDVVREYYRKVLTDIDFNRLKSLLDNAMTGLTENEMDIFNSFIQNIMDMSKSANEVDFRGSRMDWFRLQTYLSYKTASFDWASQENLTQYMNTVILHTNLYDNLEHLIMKFTSLHFLQFHRTKLWEVFENCLETPNQHNFLFVYPRICQDFISTTNENCPEDFNVILKQSNDLVRRFINQICLRISKYFQQMLNYFYEGDLKLLPYNGVDQFVVKYHKVLGANLSDYKVKELPGSESKVKDMSVANDITQIITQFSSIFNSRDICVNGRIYDLCAFLQKELIRIFIDIIKMYISVKMKREKHEIITRRRPSEMLLIIKLTMSLISRISENVNINPSLIFQNVFLSQSLKKDSIGHDTINDLYTKWYLGSLLQQPHFIHVSTLDCLLTIIPQHAKDANNVIILTEEYTDIEELKALVQILGPYGVRLMTERLMLKVISYVSVLRNFVMRNKVTLMKIEVLSLDNSKTKGLLSQLEDVDEFCENWRQLGILMAFKNLFRKAVKSVTEKTLPFLTSIVEDLQQEYEADISDNLSSVSEQDEPIIQRLKTQLMINELCQAFGCQTKIDSSLFMQLEDFKREQQQAQNDQSNQRDDSNNMLLFIAAAYLLPNIVGSNTYLIQYEAVENNIHCCAYAIRDLLFAFFGPNGEDCAKIAAKEFLIHASTNLLGLGMSTSTSSTRDAANFIKNRDSIYLVFDFIIQNVSDLISVQMYENCFPYALVRQAYHNVAKAAMDSNTRGSRDDAV